MATHSSTLAWKIHWTEEPGGLQSMGSLRVWDDWATSLSLFTFHFHALEKEMATHSSVLTWRIPGKGEPGGLPSMGSHRVRHDWSDLAAAAAAMSVNRFYKLIILKLNIPFSFLPESNYKLWKCLMKTTEVNIWAELWCPPKCLIIKSYNYCS